MTRCIALLRGVNVGRATRIAMAEWRRQLATLGLRDVGIADSALVQARGRVTGASATARNRATVGKLQALVSGARDTEG